MTLCRQHEIFHCSALQRVTWTPQWDCASSQQVSDVMTELRDLRKCLDDATIFHYGKKHSALNLDCG